MITITESGMNFGPYQDKDVFYIEKSKIYANINKKVKIAEFILKKDKALIFIEAKSSVPNPYGEKPENFNLYIDTIVEKLNNSLAILLSAKLNILNDEDEEINNFIDLYDLKDTQIAFRLIVKKAEKKHLIDVQKALIKKLTTQMIIWNITVNVLSEETAKKYNLIS